MHEEKNPISFFFSYAYPVSLIQIFGQRTLSSLCDFGTLIQDHLTTYRRVYSGLCFLPLVYNSVFMQVPHWFDYYSFVAWFEPRNCEVSNLVLFSRFFWLFQVPWDAIWILGWNSLLTKKKNANGILMGVTFNSEIALDSTNILRISGPPVYEHRITHHLFLSSLSKQCFIIFSYTVLHFIG